MPYPSGQDLAAWMVSQGLLESLPGDLTAMEAAAEGAAAEWERDTLWVPFLAGDATARTFDGPGGCKLDLPAGLVSATSVTIGGQALTADEDFFLEDQRVGGPYQSIEFSGFVPRLRRSVVVTGVWGWSTVLPADVKLAILGKAAATALSNPNATGSVTVYQAGPVKYEYAASTAANATPAGRLLDAYASSVKAYKRWG